MKKNPLIVALVVISALILAMLVCVAVILVKSQKPENDNGDQTEAVTTTARTTAATTPEDTKKTYFITFYNDTEMLAKVECAEGEYPSYPGEIPKKASDEQNDYVFTGWEPEIVPAVEGTMYKAVFKAIDRTVKVRFMNIDGSLLEEKSVPYKASVAPTTAPADHEDGKYFCKFLGWAPDAAGTVPVDLSEIRSDMTLYPVYELTQIKSLAKFILDDGTVYKEEYVTIGEKPAPVDPVKEPTEQYSYKFTGWTPEIAAIGTEDIVYTASFEAAVRSYTVKFIDSKRETEKTVSVKYGEPAIYPGDTSDLPYGAYTLHFERWTVSATLADEADISAITGDMTVYAYYSYLNVTREDITFSGSVSSRNKDVDKVWVTLEWTSERKAGSPTSTIKVKATITSYSLNLGARPLTVTFGSHKDTDESPTIKLTDNSKQTSKTIYEGTFTVDVPDAMPHTETLTFDWSASFDYSVKPSGRKDYSGFSLTTEVKY